MIILLLLSANLFYIVLFLGMVLTASYYYVTDVKPKRRWTGLRYVAVLE
jgi:formate hydrogenlyase subunit 3/multisubunit Na+/H+ antiporter MnhD subunit